MRSARSRVTVGVLSVAVVTLGVAVPSASASTLATGGGTLELGPPTLIWEQTLGNRLITDEYGSLSFAGSIAGTGTITVLADVSPQGTETFVAQWSAEATVDGRTGVVDMSLDGTDNGTYSGDLIACGTGRLAGFVGTGHYTGQDTTGAGTYTLKYLER
jgi:hypothetical protein